MKAEYEDVLHFALHTDLLLGRMLTTVIQLAGAILALLVSIIVGLSLGSTVGFLIDPWKHFSNPHLTALVIGLTSMLIAAAIACLMTILKMAWKYINLFSSVRFFESYVESIPIDLRDKDMEKLVECAAWERAIPSTTAVRYQPTDRSQAQD